MGSRPGPAMVRGLFAPPRAWVLRSGAPPEPSVAERTKAIQWRRAGRMVVAGGAARSIGPASSWWFPWVYGTSPSGKGRILTSA